MRQHSQQRLPALRGHKVQQLRRKLHQQMVLPVGVGEASCGLGTAVRQRHIGLYVKNGGTVQQVRPPHPQNRACRILQIHPLQLHAGETDGVGPEGRAGGKHSHAPVSSQTGRPHSGGPPLALRKLPEQPQVGEILQPSEGLRHPVGRQKLHPAQKLLHQAALSGNAEFLRKLCANVADRLQGQRLPLQNRASSASEAWAKGPGRGFGSLCRPK